MASTESFTAKIVGIVVSVIVVAAVAIPVLSSVTTGLEAGTTKTILEILPVFLVLAILMTVVTVFLNKKQ